MKIENKPIVFMTLWLALMLVYLLGDVLRIYAGDYKPGLVDGKPMPQITWLGLAFLMFLPILMMLLNILFPFQWLRYANIIISIVLFIFNALGLPSYKAYYDIFLIVIGLLINAITIWLAWIK